MFIVDTDELNKLVATLPSRLVSVALVFLVGSSHYLCLNCIASLQPSQLGQKDPKNFVVLFVVSSN